ncbi:MAG TPA: Npt1/Npt2 family nucleotide transporter [Acidobacteriota bacterium]|nr:Npt1/Npt2 family nucleotide transporter [Acidobacteriota bacterium]
MLKRMGRILHIKPGEGLITALMFLYIFSALTFYYILKPMRSSFFLKNLPSTSLPYAYILTAVFAGTLTTLIFKFSRRLSVISLLTLTNLGVVGTLFGFRWAMGRAVPFLPYIWFIYLQIISVMTVAQFWLFAGYLYDNRQAKRLYALLGAGAITGSMAGSLIPGYLSKNLSVDARLLICVSICLGMILLAQIAWRFRRPQEDLTGQTRKYEEPRERLADLFRLIFGSRHLGLMVLLVFLTLVASQIAEWQLNNSLDAAYAGVSKAEREASIDQYWGRFYFWTNSIGVILQVSITGIVVSRMGIGTAILFLPGSLMLASLGVMFVPSLLTTSLALGSNNVFRYSVNRAGFELLYLPLSPASRKRMKLFVDVFVDRFGRAIAALVILSFTELRGTAAAAIVLTGASLIVGFQLRKAYVNEFRRQLARREVDLTEIRRYVTDPASLKLLVSALESSQERQILYSLGLLQSARGFDFSAQLLPLLRHPSALVREEAARTLSALPGNHDAEAERLFSDASAGVRLAAVEYLCSHDLSKTAERLSSLLTHENPDIRLAAARCASNQPSSAFRPSMDLVRNLMTLEGSGSIQAREAAARLAAQLPAPDAVSVLREFLRDHRPEIAGAAALAAGGAGHMDLLPEILPMLARRALRAASRQALVLFGSQITAELGAVLSDEKRDLALRREVPWVLSQLQTAAAADVLLENLNAEDFNLKYQVVKGLSRVHARKPELPAKQRLVTVHVIAQTMAYYEGLALCESLGCKTGGDGSGLLGRALQERLGMQLEMIFRLLGLEYPQKDIYFAYAALKGSRPQMRSSAIEFLDNVLSNSLKSIILPLLEEESTERLLGRASRLFGVGIPDREDALHTILRQPDSWLKACALHTIGADRIAGLTDLCRQMAEDTNPLIRETADWAAKMAGLTKADGYLHADHP